MAKPVNSEGLTFEEWCAAAGVRSLAGRWKEDHNWLHNKELPSKHRQAWKNGEDPADHRESSTVRHFEWQCPTCRRHYSIFSRHTRAQCEQACRLTLEAVCAS